MKHDNDDIPADLLIGAKAIGAALGITGRQVYRLVYDEGLPHFKLGGSIAARRKKVLAWLDEKERAAA